MREEEDPFSSDGGSPLTPRVSRLSLIVAMAKNRVIGADNKIPWHLPNELKLFKSLTMGHHIIMGRKTYESIGRLLPGRTTVIVTRQREYAVAGAVVAHSIDEALAACKGDAEVFVIGGADLFRVTLPVADRLYLTTVDAEPAGDVYMPELEPGAWNEISAESFDKDDKHAHAYRLVIYDSTRGGDGRPAPLPGERE
jgi:dihydrofolate reductase